MPWLPSALFSCVVLLILGGLAFFVRACRFRQRNNEPEALPFAMAELTESFEALTRAQSEQAGIPIEIAVSPAVPRRLVGDARRIQQILLTYVTRALKVAGRGKILVTVWARHATVGSVELTFAVSDDGPGTATSGQQRPGGRLEPETPVLEEPNFTECKILAEKMGGRSWVEREPELGTTSYLSLNLVLAEELAASGPRIFPAPDPLANLRLLVRTKNTTMLTELTLFLTELDGEIAELAAAVAATDASAARQAAHRLAGRFYFVDASELADLVNLAAAAARTNRWDDARRISAELRARAAAMSRELLPACPTHPAG